MLPAALGTQVVGSIIRPASYCGCYGFKPSLGAINRGGSHDGLSQSCHGALAASLHDAWNLCWAIAQARRRRSGLPRSCGTRSDAGGAGRRARSRCSKRRAGRSRPTKRSRRLPAAVERIREADVIVIDRMSNKVVADVEKALEPGASAVAADQCVRVALAARHLSGEERGRLEPRDARTPRRSRSDDARRLSRRHQEAHAHPRNLCASSAG